MNKFFDIKLNLDLLIKSPIVHEGFTIIIINFRSISDRNSMVGSELQYNDMTIHTCCCCCDTGTCCFRSGTSSSSCRRSNTTVTTSGF